jgi:hypothetical protein
VTDNLELETGAEALKLALAACVRAGIGLGADASTSLSRILAHLERTALNASWLFWHDSSTVTFTASAVNLTSAVIQATVPATAKIVTPSGTFSIPTSGRDVYAAFLFFGGAWGSSLDSSSYASHLYFRSITFSGNYPSITGRTISGMYEYIKRTPSSAAEAIAGGNLTLGSTSVDPGAVSYTFSPYSTTYDAWRYPSGEVIWCMRNPGNIVMRQ